MKTNLSILLGVENRYIPLKDSQDSLHKIKGDIKVFIYI